MRKDITNHKDDLDLPVRQLRRTNDVHKRAHLHVTERDDHVSSSSYLIFRQPKFIFIESS